MTSPFTSSDSGLPLYPVNSASYEQWLANLPGASAEMAEGSWFPGEGG